MDDLPARLEARAKKREEWLRFWNPWTPANAPVIADVQEEVFELRAAAEALRHFGQG